MLFDVDALILGGGLLLIALIIFAETGLLFGFFLPGDTLLIAAGFLASQGKLSIESVLLVSFLAAVVGYHTGYLIGKHSGPRIFKRQNGIFFRQEYVHRTERFFSNHGGKAIIFARFVPIVRTFVSLVAGVGKMDRNKFIIYNLLGAFLWVVSMCLAGYFIGQAFPDLDKYLILLLLAAVLGSFVLGLYQLFRYKDTRQRLKQALREEWIHYSGKSKPSG